MNRVFKILITAPLLLAGSTAFGQDLTNQDDCANASMDLRLGDGTWGWDNSGRTTGAEGQAEPACYKFGTSSIQGDIWFHWTPNQSGSVVIDTCAAGGTNADTKIAAYGGPGCPATGSALDCNDDTCGLRSTISFPTTCGTTYLIQLGSFPGSTDGSAFVTASEAPGPPCVSNPVDELTASIDGPQANAGTGTGSPGTGTASLTLDPATNQLTWNISWSGVQGTPTAMHLHGPATPDQNAGVQVPIDISGGPPAMGSTILAASQASDLLAGLWYVNLHTTQFPAGEIRGQIYRSGPIEYICDPSNANSTGQGAVLTYQGNRDRSQGAYTGILTTTQLPPNQFGYYLASRTSGNLPVSNGVLCLSQDIARLIGPGQPGVENSGPNGTFSSVILTNDIPTNPNRAILAGDTWYFQAWYRDQSPTGPRSNFSTACCIPFF